MKTTKQIMGERMEYLMRTTPSLDTLKKISARSGVGYGTVRRILNQEETDVGIGNVEAVAKVFGLTLSQFISESGSGLELTPEEFELLHKFRAIKDDASRKEVSFLAAIKSSIYQSQDHS